MGIENLKNTQYWIDRSERIIIAGEKTALQMLSDLEKIYNQAIKGIQKEIEAFHGRYAKETGLSIEDIYQRLNPAQFKSAIEDIRFYYNEVDRLGMDPKYKTYLRNLSARAYMSRLEELQLQMRNHVEDLYAKIHTEFTGNLIDSYSDSYYRTLYDLQRGFGFGNQITAINRPIIEQAIKTKWLGDNYSSRIWNNKDRLIEQLNTTFLQGVARGWNPRKIGEEISRNVGTSKNSGVRLARTEFNHIANEARFAGYKEHGIFNQYKFVATLDLRTSEVCQETDLLVFNLDEKIIGVNYPPMHPNCRSTTVPYFPPSEIDNLLAKAQRAARHPVTGEYMLVQADMNYKQWKEKYVI